MSTVGAAGPGGTPVVDVHAHALVPEVFALVAGQPGLAEEQANQLRTFGTESMEVNARLGAGPYVPLLTDMAARTAVMDRAGVDVQAVSVTPLQFYYWAEPGLAREIVSTVNGHLAGLAQRHPDRVVGLGTVALQHPGLAAEQLRHAVTTLGLRGVEISSTAAGRDFSDPFFAPFWEAAAALGAFVFVHPWGCSLHERIDRFYLGNVIGQPIETTVALSHLIFGGVLDRHPGLVVCGAHGGGYLPQYIGRADHAYDVRPESRTMARRPSEYLPQLYFDSLVYRPDPLRQIVAVAGAGQVLLGTDYPFDMSVEDPVQRLDGLPELTAQERAAISGGTAARLLGIGSPANGAAADGTRRDTA